MNTCITCKHRELITAIVENVIVDDKYYTSNSDFYLNYCTDEVLICTKGRLNEMTYSGTEYPTCQDYEENMIAPDLMMILINRSSTCRNAKGWERTKDGRTVDCKKKGTVDICACGGCARYEQIIRLGEEPMISKVDVIDLFRELYDLIHGHPDNADERYNGILDGVITEFIERLEIEWELY